MQGIYAIWIIQKTQYSIEDVKSLCGADYSHMIGLAIDKYKAIGEMIDYCGEANIVSYSKLLEYARSEDLIGLGYSVIVAPLS